jgi:hypothetical protein
MKMGIPFEDSPRPPHLTVKINPAVARLQSMFINLRSNCNWLEIAWNWALPLQLPLIISRRLFSDPVKGAP